MSNLERMLNTWDEADSELNKKIDEKANLSSIVASATASATNSKTVEINGTGKAVEKLVVEGKTEQNGTPSPDNPIEVKGVGDKVENLYDKDKIVRGTTWNYQLKGLATNADLAYQYIEIPNGVKSITISGQANLNSSYFGNAFLDSNKAFISLINLKNTTDPITATVPSNAKYIVIDVYIGDNTSLVDWDTLRVSVGNEVGTKYKIPISVGDTTKNVYLNAPLFDGEKADVASGVAEKNREEIYFPTDGWNDAGTSTTDYITRYHTLTGIFANIKPNSSAYCTILQSKADTIWSNPDKAYIVVRDAVYISYPKSIDVVTFINNNNLSAFFELATPTKETFDGAEIPTSVGKNTLSVDTEVTPASVEAVTFGDYYSKAEVDKKLPKVEYGTITSTAGNIDESNTFCIKSGNVVSFRLRITECTVKNNWGLIAMLPFKPVKLTCVINIEGNMSPVFAQIDCTVSRYATTSNATLDINGTYITND